MKLPKRFTLSTLLLAMLLASLVFGYAQWRKQWLLKEVKALNLSGHLFTSLKYRDALFWPLVSGNATAVLQRQDDGTYVVGKKSVGTAEAEAFLQELTARLRSVGVEKVSYAVMVERGHTRYQVYLNLQAITDLRKDFAAIERENSLPFR